MWYHLAMFSVNDKELKRFAGELRAFTKFAYPIATQQTVNTAAFRTMETARKDVKKSMVLRNQFTTRSIQFAKSPKTLQVRRQFSRVGSTADYMETQEFGGVKRKGGSEGVPLATSYSAGQGRGVQPRTRLPRRANKLANIQLRKRGRGGSSRKQRVLMAIRGAAESGRKFVFLDLGRSKGIFRVVGGKRKPKLQMVHSLSNPAVTIPRNPWLKPAFDKNVAKLPAFYRDALVKQMKRANLFTK